MKAKPIFISLSGNFAPEWRQLVDAIGSEGDNDVHDANIADAARELVECVLYQTEEGDGSQMAPSDEEISQKAYPRCN